MKNIQENFNQTLNFSEIKKDYSQYQPISEFPSSSRDLSFSIKDPSQVQQIIKN